MLKATVPSDKTAVVQIAKTVQWIEPVETEALRKVQMQHNPKRKFKRHAGTWLSRSPLTKLETGAGTSSWPSWISHFTGSFVGHSPSEMLCPPANIIQKQEKQEPSTNQRKFYICADGPHTRLAAARLLLRFASGEGYYPFPEAEMASKYREESSIELILKLTGPRQVMPPCDGLGSTKSL